MFGISVSGIKNSQKHIDVTSNNIANANSYGFKKSRAEFADVYATSVFSNNRIAAGMGVNNTVVSQQFMQGNLSGDTGNSLDMAIQGNGFFVLSSAQQGGAVEHTYTRNGAFQLNNEGYIVTATGEYLQGWDVNADGTSTSLDLNSTHSIQLPADTGAPHFSENVGIGVNLPADKDPVESIIDPIGFDGNKLTDYTKYGRYFDPATGDTVPPNADGSAPDGAIKQYYTGFDPKNSSTYTASTSQTIHDSLGGAHTLTYYMIKLGPNGVPDAEGKMQDGTDTVWAVIPYVDGEPVDIAKQGGENPLMISPQGQSSIAGSHLFGFQVTFDSNGEMKNPGGLIPSKLELVNPQGGDTTGKIANSLRHELFGVPGETTPSGSLETTFPDLIDQTFETKGDQKAHYPDGDGSLYKTLGVGVNPNQVLNIDFNATQYGSSKFSVTEAPTNDGYATGVLLGMEVSEDGIIQCQYSNGRVVNVAKVALADFTNVQGLNKIGDSQWSESRSSGQAIAREANEGSAGAIKGSNLELSNVDLTTELVELITAQRNYQANAQGLQTQNTVMDSILNIR